MNEIDVIAATNDPVRPIVLWVLLVAVFGMGMLAGAGLTRIFMERRRDGDLNTHYRSIFEDPDMVGSKPTRRSRKPPDANS